MQTAEIKRLERPETTTRTLLGAGSRRDSGGTSPFVPTGVFCYDGESIVAANEPTDSAALLASLYQVER